MSLDYFPRLSRKLRASCLFEDGMVMLYSRNYQESAAKLPDKLREEVNELFAHIGEAVPSDFAVTLFFELSGVECQVVFEDGNTEADAIRGHFTSLKSLIRTMKRQKWDDLRADLIQRGGIFDELVREADDRPVNIPSSKDAAKRYGSQLIQEIGKNRHLNHNSPFTLIIARDDLGICSEQLESRDAVEHTIADRMTTRNDILAVLEQGSPWSFEEIESIKLKAMEGLGPISRAKAEGRLVI